MSNKKILALVVTAMFVALLAVPVERGAARTTLDVDLYCISLGHQRLECQFEVSGGTGVYSYQFTPQATHVFGPSGFAIVPCGPPYTYEQVTLYVTDSNGATGNAVRFPFCGDAV